MPEAKVSSEILPKVMLNWESSIVMVPMSRSLSPMFVTVRICGVLDELTDTVPKSISNLDTVMSGPELVPDKKALTGFSTGLFVRMDVLPGGKIKFVRITSESKPFKKNPSILHLLNWWNRFRSIFKCEK